jgi:hypothetical protein
MDWAYIMTNITICVVARISFSARNSGSSRIYYVPILFVINNDKDAEQ